MQDVTNKTNTARPAITVLNERLSCQNQQKLTTSCNLSGIKSVLTGRLLDYVIKMRILKYCVIINKVLGIYD